MMLSTRRPVLLGGGGKQSQGVVGGKSGKKQCRLIAAVAKDDPSTISQRVVRCVSCWSSTNRLRRTKVQCSSSSSTLSARGYEEEIRARSRSGEGGGEEEKNASHTGAASRRRRKVVRQGALWQKRLEELRAFKAEHGHLVVPISPPTSLSSWVYQQRLLRRRGDLSPERCEAIEELGFCWETGVNRAKWEKRLEELRAFKAAHGHLDVPARGPSGTLRSWVYRQCLLRRRGALSHEREAALQELGLCCEPPARARRGTRGGAGGVAVGTRQSSSGGGGGGGARDAMWARRFEELRSFSRAHGHTRVPSRTKLYSWLHSQRRICDSLSDERRATLEAIGVDLRRIKPNMSWEARLDQLRAFRDAHGHCAVPVTWRHNTPLGRWVATQRKHYRAGTLSVERKDALQQLGFEWERRRGRKPRASMGSLHVRQNVSPWALVPNDDDGDGGDEIVRVDVSWIGGPEMDMEQTEERRKDRLRCFDEEEAEEEIGTLSVGGWGKGSTAYEEKQEYVFSRINGWWKGDGGDEKHWLDARGKVRAMRYNYAVQAKQKRRIKPDIVIEVEESDERGGDVKTKNIIWGLVIEVDEFAHRRGNHYSWREEEERMQELQTTLDVPLKFVRFNPDPDMANPTTLEERTRALIEHIVESTRQAPKRDLEVAYVMY